MLNASIIHTRMRSALEAVYAHLLAMNYTRLETVRLRAVNVQ